MMMALYSYSTGGWSGVIRAVRGLRLGMEWDEVGGVGGGGGERWDSWWRGGISDTGLQCIW